MYPFAHKEVDTIPVNPNTKKDTFSFNLQTDEYQLVGTVLMKLKIVLLLVVIFEMIQK